VRWSSAENEGDIYSLGGCRVATVTGTILVPALAINSNISKIMHRASVMQMLKQTIQLLSKKYIET
jgi:hypothetical protein